MWRYSKQFRIEIVLYSELKSRNCILSQLSLLSRSAETEYRAVDMASSCLYLLLPACEYLSSLFLMVA